MSDYRTIMFLIVFLLSLYGCADLAYKYEKKKIIRELKELKNPSKVTKLLVEEYSHFFETKWWHWVSIIGLAGSIIGGIYDSY
jgi:hypothetical protein